MFFLKSEKKTKNTYSRTLLLPAARLVGAATLLLSGSTSPSGLVPCGARPDQMVEVPGFVALYGVSSSSP